MHIWTARYIIRTIYITSSLVVTEPTNTAGHVLGDEDGIGLFLTVSEEDNGVCQEARRHASGFAKKTSVSGLCIQTVRLTIDGRFLGNAQQQRCNIARRSTPGQ